MTKEEKKEYLKQWRIKNKEKIKAQKKEHYNNHKEEEKKKSLEYYFAHKEQTKERHKQYEIANKEKLKLKRKKYCIENKEKIKEYHDTHKEERRKSSLKREYKITLEEYNQMLEKQKDSCAICHEKFKSSTHTQVDHDHKTGKVRGLLCRKCNSILGYSNDEIQILLNAINYLKNNDTIL
jgi:hypothetical protein